MAATGLASVDALRDERQVVGLALDGDALEASTMHASTVVPEPANGSGTVPPGGVTSRTSQRMGKV